MSQQLTTTWPDTETGTAPAADVRRETLAARKFDPTKRPTDAPPVYTLSGVSICTPGNLTAISASAKAGKSAFVGAMMASVMTPGDADTFSLSSGNPKGLAVVHIDTEQSVADHWHLVDCAIRRAGVDAPPDWLISYQLTGIPALEAQGLVEFAIEDAAARFKGVHSVLIDGMADLVSDVNDPEECNGYVAHLHGIAIKFDCPIAGVIHFNPNSEKTRGHLGSQLERKSETNLILEKDGTVTTVYSLKQRRAPILKSQGPRFQWDDKAGMHVSCESQVSAKDEQERQKAICERDDVFAGRASMRWCDLQVAIRETLKGSERTADRRMEKWRKLGVIEKSFGGQWIPTK